MYITLFCPLLLLPLLLLFNYTNSVFCEQESILIDPMERFNLTYPLNWKMKYENNHNILLIPPSDTSYNNTYFKISRILQYNHSLNDHVFRHINNYISKYLLGDFISFRINNIDSNFSIFRFPAYKLEFDVVMNDNFQSPVSFIEYFTIYDNQLFKFRFSQDGQIKTMDKKIIESIIKSIKFNS